MIEASEGSWRIEDVEGEVESEMVSVSTSVRICVFISFPNSDPVCIGMRGVNSRVCRDLSTSVDDDGEIRDRESAGIVDCRKAEDEGLDLAMALEKRITHGSCSIPLPQSCSGNSRLDASSPAFYTFPRQGPRASANLGRVQCLHLISARLSAIGFFV